MIHLFRRSHEPSDMFRVYTLPHVWKNMSHFFMSHPKSLEIHNTPWKFYGFWTQSHGGFFVQIIFLQGVNFMSRGAKLEVAFGTGRVRFQFNVAFVLNHKWIYDLPSSIITCGHLLSHVGIYYHMWPSIIICGHLSTCVVIYHNLSS